MKVNVCMIAKDRPRLTRQAIESLIANTPTELFNLTVIDDQSTSVGDDGLEVEDIVNGIHEDEDAPRYNVLTVRLSRSKGIVGFVRNLSIRISEQYWGRGDFLLAVDNDLAFLPGWLEKMLGAFVLCEGRGLKVLGGVRHPYHGVNAILPTLDPDSERIAKDPVRVAITDAVAGYCHLMRWETWDKYGAYDAHAQGTGASEDYGFCRKIVDDGGLVGYIEPAVMHNCGVTNTEGKPATGSETFPRIPGIVME